MNLPFQITQSCSLLTLPAEIRNIIYEFSFAGDVMSVHDVLSSRVLTLPAAVRNRVYNFYLTRPASSEEDGNWIDVFATRHPRKDLLSTCRKVYKEARGMYKASYRSHWTSNKFLIQDDRLSTRTAMVQNLKLLSAQDLQYAHRLRIIMPCTSYSDNIWERHEQNDSWWLIEYPYQRRRITTKYVRFRQDRYSKWREDRSVWQDGSYRSRRYARIENHERELKSFQGSPVEYGFDTIALPFLMQVCQIVKTGPGSRIYNTTGLVSLCSCEHHASFCGLCREGAQVSLNVHY